MQRIRERYTTGNARDPEKLLKQAVRFLERKKLTRFFTIRTDEHEGLYVAYDTAKIEFEALLDGKFILRTNEKTMSIEQVIAAYKNLARVEKAFCELKDFIEVRPIRHFADLRVEAHIFICVLAYLIEIALELTLKRNDIPLTAREALNQLSEIKLISQTIEGITIKTVCCPKTVDRTMIKALSITLPKEKIFR